MNKHKDSALIINIYGAPGAGKSTLAAGLFHVMKKSDSPRLRKAEYAPEYAKAFAWEGDTETLSDQMFISKSQQRLVDCCAAQVNYIVTDSPILLGLIYAKEPTAELTTFITESHHKYRSINLFIERTKAFSPQGRVHGEEESDALSVRILDMLKQQGIEPIRINSQTSPDGVLESIQKQDAAL